MPMHLFVSRQSIPWCLLLLHLSACSSSTQSSEETASTDSASAVMLDTATYAPETFGYDLDFLQQHQTVIVLRDSANRARVLLCPAYQGRVMTSTLNGNEGVSLGWMNYNLIASKKFQPHFNAFGGEDRFWLGPEGGQYGLFFQQGTPFDLANWQTPAPIDTEPFDVVSSSEREAVFTKTMHLTNYSGTEFDVNVNRRVQLLSKNAVSDQLGISVPASVNFVAFQSENTITNAGKKAWKKEGGLLSVWILGMFTPSPATVIAIPFNETNAAGSVVNDAYFGKVPANRLVQKDGVIYFKGDGNQRGKIGLSYARAKSVLGSYDARRRVLTVVQYNKPERPASYVNSMWEMQRNPYGGDVINSYNDGPTAPGGKPLGPFYELETSSPAAALAPGGSLTHVHRTFHFSGDEAALNEIATRVLGVTVQEIAGAL